MANQFKPFSLLAGTALIAWMSLSSVTASASSNDILFILDGSGSMWGQIDGVAKIETAKSTLSKLMDDVPGDARLGFMTYGTKSKSSCDDVSVMNQIGSDRDAIKGNIQALTPLGKTPIQKSLIDGLNVLASAEPGDVQKSLVLISDGIETCEGDPCAVAASASQRGVKMQVHVVGFDVDAETRSQLECIAKQGGGQYFNASDTEGFKTAMNKVVEVAQAAPAQAPAPAPEVKEEPKGPTITEFFRDDFDGSELSENWAVENANTENFIVDGGVLTMLSTSKGGFGAEQPENLITYTGDMPKGDWDAEITFTGELSGTNNVLTFGLRKDKDNYLTSSFAALTSSICFRTQVSNTKVTNGGEPETVSAFYRGQPLTLGNCYARFELGKENKKDVIDAHVDTPTKVTFSKRGRSYTVSMGMEGLKRKDESPFVVATKQFTSLRSPGTLAFTVSRPGDSNTKGEVLLNIDSIVINKVEE